MPTRVSIIVMLGLSLLAGGGTAFAQDPHKAMRDQVNLNTVFVAGGSLGATYHAIANDIALVTSDDKLRVVSLTTSSAVQNVRDLIYMRSVDFALTNPRVLNVFVASGELGPDLKRQILYVSPLATEEAHVLAQPEYNSLADLKGKKVSFHIAGSSSASAGLYIFKMLGIDVQVFNLPQPEAIEKMRSKELDATVCICPKLVPAYSAVKADTGFKFLEVPYPPALEGEFLPSKIGGEDYPSLVEKDKSVRTIALYTILVTLNWPKSSQRYQRNARFVEALFSRYEEFLKPPRQPSWKTVNFAAKVSGWTRFAPAQEWLDRHQREAKEMRTSFDEFLDVRAGKGRELSTGERERLFREFQDWKRRK
jgi:TRAP-type uncharacterized transport system substrate-binding protein